MIEQLKNAKTWEERYRLIIQAGKNLPRPTEDELAQMQLITGCEAQMWFQILTKNDRTFQFKAFSEARIMNGLLWILLQTINGKTTNELQCFDFSVFFTKLGIAQRLSETRLNGLNQIEQLVKQQCI
ncbi:MULTISPECIES: SufE family protein [Rodentibacter]|uniref:SufE family protein n=1 Tax=Rodentibacter TaxID=1960084 RepID=UPI001CFCA425|nr:SufE family protein [Rodentibacter sp. JRC1]GJI54981.1 putative SufE-like protein [Rodentibacter sp. JRC1]